MGGGRVPERVSKRQVRDWAYRTLALAMVGESAIEDAEGLEAAFIIVLSDDRKTKQAFERTLQVWAAGVILALTLKELAGGRPSVGSGAETLLEAAGLLEEGP